MSKDTKILLTGGSGFIGSHLIEYLKNDYDLSVYDINKPNYIMIFLPFPKFYLFIHSYVHNTTKTEIDSAFPPLSSII